MNQDNQKKFKNAKMLVIRGVPGSGKSTLAKQLQDGDVYQHHVEADMYFIDDEGNYNFDASKLRNAHEWCQKTVRYVLENDMSVIVSNTFTTEREIEPYRQMAYELGIPFTCIIVENRHGGNNKHGVPAEKIQQMKDRFSFSL